MLEPRALKVTYIDLDNSHSVQADLILERTREALKGLRGQPEQPAAIHPSRGVEPDNQQLLGTLSSTLAELVHAFPDHPATPHVALAIHKLMPQTAFIVQAKHEDKGITTTLIDVECSDPAKAKEAIEARTEIRMLRDFQGMQKMINPSPKAG